MVYIFAGLILLFCAPTVFMPSSRLPAMYVIGGLVLALGVAGLAWANTVAARFIAEHPSWAGSPLHPETANFFGGVMVIFGTGIFLAIGVRYVMITLRVMKPR